MNERIDAWQMQETMKEILKQIFHQETKDEVHNEPLPRRQWSVSRNAQILEKGRCDKTHWQNDKNVILKNVFQRLDVISILGPFARLDPILWEHAVLFHDPRTRKTGEQSETNHEANHDGW